MKPQFKCYLENVLLSTLVHTTPIPHLISDDSRKLASAGYHTEEIF